MTGLQAGTSPSDGPPAGRLARQAVVFVGAEVLNKAIPFLLLPVLTRHLATSDYGIAATILATQSVLAVLAGLSTHGAVSVAYFRLAPEELPGYVRSTLAVLAASAAVAVGLTAALAPVIGPRLGVPGRWLVLAAVLASAQFITSINLTLWQCERRARAYGGYQVGQTLTTAAVTVGLVVGLGLDWRGQILGAATGVLVFAGASVVVLGRRGYLRGSVARAHVWDALTFGVPLVPHALSAWILTALDRLYLSLRVGTEGTGLYAAAYQLALIIGVLAAAFNRAWVPHLFGRLGTLDQAGRLRLVRETYAYFAVILLLALSFASVAPSLASWFLGPRFADSGRYVFWIALAFAFDGMYYMVVNQLFYAKRTRVLAAITLAVGLGHAALSWTLIRRNGALGAAQAMTASFALQFALVWLASARAFPLPWVSLQLFTPPRRA